MLKVTSFKSCAVPKKHWNAFKKVMDRYDVEATRIGTGLDVRQEDVFRGIHGRLLVVALAYLRNSSIFFSKSLSSGLVKLL